MTKKKQFQKIEPPQTIQLTYQNNMCLVELNEYNTLKHENFEMKSRILILSDTEKILKEEIITRDKTIQELRKENDELKQKIKALESKMEKLENKITILEQESNKTKSKQRINKYIIAINDFNRIMRMETKVSNSVRDSFYELRMNRIEISHYFDDLDDINFFNAKKKIFFNKIQDMSDEDKKMFNELYPEILDTTIEFNDDPGISVSTKLCSIAEKWWR